MGLIKTFEQFTNPYDIELYIDDYLFTDFTDIYDEDIEDNPELIDKVRSDIKDTIDWFKSLKYPIEVWRGLELNGDINLDKYTYNEQDLGCWTINKSIATGFGNIIFNGFILSEDDVNIEQTIRTNIINPGEKEINVKDSNKIRIINIEKKTIK